MANEQKQVEPKIDVLDELKPKGDHKFKKGKKKTGGRKPGTSNKSKAFKSAIEPHAEEILLGLLEKARNGDLDALTHLSRPYVPKNGVLAESCDKLVLTGNKAERANQLVIMYEKGEIDSERVKNLLSMYREVSELEQHQIIVSKLDAIQSYLESKL